MLETELQIAIALITAHLLADFVFQTRWMVDNKRNLGVMALHGLIVAGLSLIALGGQPVIALGIAVVHVVIDLIKVWTLPEKLWVFLLDQAAHLVTIAGVLWLFPQVQGSGLWQAALPEVFDALVFACGLIVATLAGGPAVGLLMDPYKANAQSQGLLNAGRTIGLLERTLIFLMVMIGEPTAIGFLIAAKSILRFDTASKDQKVSEYVIIGTLASFGWALIAAFATKAVLQML